MYDISSFALSDMIQCSTTIRSLGKNATSMEEVANRLVCYLYEHLHCASTGEPACALVRYYKTHPYGQLPADLQSFASQLSNGQPLAAHVPCLTLLATAGMHPAWNRRSESVGHQTIPLPSAQVITQAPMIAQLIQQFGIDANVLVDTDSTVMVDLAQKSYNVFYVPEAQGSSGIPAQDGFVIPYGIRSVLGFGGLLPPKDLFAIIMFTTVPIPRDTADLFKTVALSAKTAVLPFTDGRVFA